MAGRIEGNVVAISESGDLVTDIQAEQLAQAPRDQSVTIRCDEHETVGIYGADHSEPESTFLARLNGDGRMQLEIVGLSAAIMLGIRVGEKVTVQW